MLILPLISKLCAQSCACGKQTSAIQVPSGQKLDSEKLPRIRQKYSLAARYVECKQTSYGRTCQARKKRRRTPCVTPSSIAGRCCGDIICTVVVQAQLLLVWSSGLGMRCWSASSASCRPSFRHLPCLPTCSCNVRSWSVSLSSNANAPLQNPQSIFVVSFR